MKRKKRKIVALVIALSLMLTGFTTTAHAAQAQTAVQQNKTIEMIPGTGITQQYVDDLCTYFGASAAMVGMGNGQNVFLCASWCRQDYVGQLFPGDEATGEKVCAELGLPGWAYNNGTPADFYAATGMVQGAVTQVPAKPAYLSQLDCKSDALAGWMTVKQYSFDGTAGTSETNNSQRDEVDILKGLNGIAEAMASRTEAMTDRQKVEWAAARIADSTAYSYSTYNKYLRGESTSNDDVYGIAGALRGSAVCSGYVDLFALYMYMEGIPCQYVGGTATDSAGTDSHAWNRVLVDGQWLEVDTTWNDSLGRGYILLTHDEMAADHHENYAVDITSEFDALFVGAGISKGEGWVAALADTVKAAITAKEQVISAYNSALAENQKQSIASDPEMIALEQSLRDGTLEVVKCNTYTLRGLTRCKIQLRNTATGETQQHQHLCEAYGCTKESCAWLESVMAGN